MIQIDGSQGEGGGQILRSALALSMATGRPFRITGIRAGRPKPGLMRQHLTCVHAAQKICSATVVGDSIGSRELTFTPAEVRPGSYHIAIGSAGGTTLVLQAVLPALLFAAMKAAPDAPPSTITIEGGTHNQSAPPFDFLERSLTPLLNRAGANVRVRLERHGFYPAGGGRIVAEVSPAPSPRYLELIDRGERRAARARALVSRIPVHIAERELVVLRERLALEPEHTEAVIVPNPIGPGNIACVELEYEHVTEVLSAVGELNRSAEAVARDLAEDARAYIRHQKPVGEHLADQLMVPLALLGGGRYATCPLSEHSRTNIAVMQLFGARVDASSDDMISVHPLAS